VQTVSQQPDYSRLIGTVRFFATSQLNIHEGYSPSSSQNKQELPGFAGCLAIQPAALAIRALIHFSGTLIERVGTVGQN
jgi:hypothetical protein